MPKHTTKASKSRANLNGKANQFPSVEVHQPQLAEVSPQMVDSQTATKTLVVDCQTATTKRVAVHHKRKVDSRTGDRHATDRVKWSGRFRPDIWKRISDFCHEREIEKLYFFEAAALHLIEMVEAHRAELVEGETPHDDVLMIYKTCEDIISLYLGLTGNKKWKPADDRVGCQFNDADRRFLEIGMLRTVINFKGKRINSFAYFRPEIEHTINEMWSAKLSDEAVEIMLKRRRQQAAEKLNAQLKSRNWK